MSTSQRYMIHPELEASDMEGKILVNAPLTPRLLMVVEEKGVIP